LASRDPELEECSTSSSLSGHTGDNPALQTATPVQPPHNAAKAAGSHYVPPHLRENVERARNGTSGGATTPVGAEQLAVFREVRSQLNKVASANVGTTAQRIAAAFEEHPRHIVIDAIVTTTMQV
jgi:hypothetical protein